MGLDALCYIVLLVMPVLGRMSDQQEDIRLMASRCFANLVTLMPLEVYWSDRECLESALFGVVLFNVGYIIFIVYAFGGIVVRVSF